MSMLRRAARRRAKDEPADGHSTAWRPCTAQHSPAGPAQHCGHCTALRALHGTALHGTADTARHCGPARHCGHCPCATNNGDSSRPPCLSAGSPLARLASQQALPPVRLCLPLASASLLASLPPCRALSLPLFAVFPVVLRPCAVRTGMFSPLALARLAPFPYLCGYEYHARQQAHPS